MADTIICCRFIARSSERFFGMHGMVEGGGLRPVSPLMATVIEQALTGINDQNAVACNSHSVRIPASNLDEVSFTGPSSHPNRDLSEQCHNKRVQMVSPWPVTEHAATVTLTYGGSLALTEPPNLSEGPLCDNDRPRIHLSDSGWYLGSTY